MESNLEPFKYRPPFITETDEPTFNDCMVCSILMAEAAHTLGEVVTGDDWRPLNDGQLKSLREHLRNLLAADRQTGELTFADARTFIQKQWPFLPPVPFWDDPAEFREWPRFVDDLQHGSVAALAGNPINVNNEHSKLRQWLVDDDYDHVIYIDRVDEHGNFFVMDPLGPPKGYDGQLIPGDEVRQYARFKNIAGKELVNAAVFKRGAASRAQRAAADAVKGSKAAMAAQAKAVKAAQQAAKAAKGLDGALATSKAAQAQVVILTTQKQTLSDQVATLTTTNQTLTTQNQALTDQVATLTTTNQTLTDQVATLTTTNQTLTTQNQALTDQVATLQSSLVAANEALALCQQAAKPPV